MELCQRDDLPSLCLTARWLYEISNPILYSHVDLSIHNRGQVKARPTDADRTSQTSDSYWCTLVWDTLSYIYLLDNYDKQMLNAGCVLQTQPS